MTSRKRPREFLVANVDLSEGSSSSSNEEDEDEDSIVRLPIIPNKTIVSKEKYASTIEKYIVAIAKIARFASESYAEYASGGLIRMHYEDVLFREKQLVDVHDEVLSYGFIHSQRPDYTNVFQCKINEEDVQRKTSLRTHLFWEICKLRWSLKKIRQHIDRTFGDSETLDKRKEESDEEYYESLTELNISLYPRKDVDTYTQRELDQAFFLLSSCWKTIDYVPALSKYVNMLIDRMCDFFCFSMSCDEMDDVDLRQPLPMEMLPHFSSSRFPDSVGGRSNGFKQSSFPIVADAEGEEYDDPRQYAPNFDFVIMCQMRLFNFLSDLALYEDRDKRDLKSSLSVYLKECVRIKNRQKNVFSRYDCTSYLNTALLKRFVLESCKHVSPEQKERTANRYVFSTFSQTDYEWLVYKQPIDLPSFADEFISKACKDSAYTQVVEKTRKTYAELLKEDIGDAKLTGFYEWCVLKNASRLFALNFDVFEKVVFNREEVRENSTRIFSYSKPLLVQFFSRYYVFYKGHLYVDGALETAETRCEQMDDINARTIYDTLLLWICIMLKDFPKSKKSKSIEATLKTKYAEYHKLEEQERQAKEYEYRKEQRSRLQMEDYEDVDYDEGRQQQKKQQEEMEEEMEENKGKYERQNIHDAYFDRAVNLDEDELRGFTDSERTKTGLYFF